MFYGELVSAGESTEPDVENRRREYGSPTEMELGSDSTPRETKVLWGYVDDIKTVLLPNPLIFHRSRRSKNLVEGGELELSMNIYSGSTLIEKRTNVLYFYSIQKFKLERSLPEIYRYKAYCLKSTFSL